MLDPIYDLLDRGGKRWRPSLGLVFAEIFGRDIKNVDQNMDIYYSCGLTEIVHNGSLMVDDVEDRSLMRRGQPCTHIKFGVDYAVNAGNFMYFVPISKVDKFIKDEKKQFLLTKIFHEELVNIHIG